MDTYVRRALVLASLAIVLATATLQAQAQSDRRLVVTIPFSFTVSGKTLPAGKYGIYRLSPTARAVVVENLDERTSAAALITSEPEIRGHAPAKLVFRRYEDRYFLSQVWPKGSVSGTQLAPTHAESEIADGSSPAVVVTLLIQHR